MKQLDLFLPRVPLLPPPQPVAEDDMISGDLFQTIHQLKKLGRGAKRIAQILELDKGTVRKYLRMAEMPTYERKSPVHRSLEGLEEWLKQRAPEVGFNGQTLHREALTKGFIGSYSTIKRFLRPIREQERIASEATIRFETSPGQQAQVDWGSALVWIGEQRVRAHFFVMVMGYSRRLFARAYLNERRHNVIDGHQQAFTWFEGYPREILYDNARTMIMTEKPAEDRLNKVFKDFADHHGFAVRFCRPYRPRTKGKVESGVKYLKRSFLKGRRFLSLDDLNACLEEWVVSVADQRIHGTTHVSPMSRWPQEKAALLPLSQIKPWQPDLNHSRRVANDCRVTVATNRYPVEPSEVGRKVQVQVAEGKVLIMNDSSAVIGEHDQLLGRFQEAPVPQDLADRMPRKTPSPDPMSPPKHDPRWPEPEVEVRDLAVYDRVAGVQEAA